MTAVDSIDPTKAASGTLGFGQPARASTGPNRLLTAATVSIATSRHVTSRRATSIAPAKTNAAT